MDCKQLTIYEATHFAVGARLEMRSPVGLDLLHHRIRTSEYGSGDTKIRLKWAKSQGGRKEAA